jgi:hypothetical protein
MRLKIVEECSHVGLVYDADGNQIGEAHYTLRVPQEMHAGAAGEVPGLTQVEGDITIDGEMWPIIHKPLVLRLADGRQLDFIFAGMGSRITPTGGSGIR